jgi:hypothetical protein
MVGKPAKLCVKQPVLPGFDTNFNGLSGRMFKNGFKQVRYLASLSPSSRRIRI